MTAIAQPPGFFADPLEAHIGDSLSAAGISGRQIASARAFHREVEGRQPFSRTVVDLGLAGDEAVARWIAGFHGWRYVPRDDLKVRGGAHKELAESIARTRHALVLARDGNRLTVAVADPTAPQFAQVRFALEGREVEWVISPQADIAARVAESYSSHLDVRDNEMERFVEEMIREAAHTRGLSDIHCIPEDRSCDIRWRIDGDLVPWGTLPGSLKDTICAQLKLSSTRGADGRSRSAISSGGLDVANRLDAQDASSIREYGSKRVSLRYSVIPAINGESIVIRILDQSAQVGSLEDLGMLGDTAMRFRSELKKPNGILLVSGPTGHGKSTTLAAAVPWLDSRNKRILSVEDPVEYRLRTVTQAPVNPRLPFGSALRAFLRPQPGHHNRGRDQGLGDGRARHEARPDGSPDPIDSPRQQRGAGAQPPSGPRGRGLDARLDDPSSPWAAPCETPVSELQAAASGLRGPGPAILGDSRDCQAHGSPCRRKRWGSLLF
jgi:general secretion pathway protein E